MKKTRRAQSRRVFISFSYDDWAVVERMMAALQQPEADTRLDTWELARAGSPVQSFHQTNRASDIRVVDCSNSSLASKWVQAEFEALSRKLKGRAIVVPVPGGNSKAWTFRKTCDQLIEEGPPNMPSEPAKWPGLRHANLVQFLEIHYGKYIGNGLTMEHIKKTDLELYRTIYYYKKHNKLPFEIPARPQILATKLEKFWHGGKDALTPQERGAVTKKLERPIPRR
jgi:hypothetical protein